MPRKLIYYNEIRYFHKYDSLTAYYNGYAVGGIQNGHKNPPLNIGQMKLWLNDYRMVE